MDCRINDFNYGWASIGDDNITLLSSLELREPNEYELLDPAIASKPLFRVANKTSSIDAYNTNKAFEYSVMTALVSKAKSIIKARTPEEQPKTTAQRSSEPKEVKQAVEEWKEKNKGNEDYYTKSSVLVSPKEFFNGKLGTYLIEDSGLNQLSDKALYTIVRACEGIKKGASDSLKDFGDPNWISIRYIPKSNAKEIIAEIKEKTYLRLGLRAEANKVVEDFNTKQTKTKKELPFTPDELVMTEQLNELIKIFNKVFAVSVINKEQLFKVIK